jgi:hypothetical protein
MTALRHPMPPEWIGQHEDGNNWPTNIFPAPDVREWLIDTFIDEAGALHNPDHQHLAGADFEVLWAAESFAKQGRIVVGQTEEVMFRAGGWQKARQEQQMGEWFGRIPGYLITFSAAYAREASDTEWCALVEHELYHIGQQVDAHGAPAWNKEGQPKLCMRGHDVEEFIGVVRRYGAGHPDGSVAQLVKAAQGNPVVSRLRLSQACGTCLLRAA